jgi:hypothetical protein
MSTTALDVDSRERAPPSEESVLDLARDPHLEQEKPTATSTNTLAAPAAEQLDLATALKVSEEFSGEIVQEKFIDRLMRGLYDQGRGAWHRLVHQSLDRRGTCRSPFGGSERTPWGVLLFVAGQRTGAVDTRGSLV